MTQGGEHRGSCHCGAVRFVLAGPLRAVIVCHCSQCRRWSGHVWAATSVPTARLRMIRDDGLAWFRSSDRAQRGFCRDCGSSLFWTPEGEARIAIAAGALDLPTGLEVADHIYRADAGDYYAPEGPPPPASVGAAGLAAAHGGGRRLDCACLCGAVAFSLPGPAGALTACHCTQCRRLSGHYSASFDASEGQVEFARRATLAEYTTAGGCDRGFCTACGSSLYFRAADGAFAVEGGVVTGPTGGHLDRHVFVAEKGDHYRIDDGLPQAMGWR